MTQDKQLCGIKLKAVLQKQRLGQALNVKEFAVLAGMSYSTAREWFRIKGFPALNGKIFWEDFTTWRRCQVGLESNLQPRTFPANASATVISSAPSNSGQPKSDWPPRAAKILTEAKG